MFLAAFLVVLALFGGAGFLISRLGSAASHSAATKGSGAAPSTGLSSADIAVKATQLGGTPFVTSDGVASLVVSPKWTPVNVPSDTPTIPRVTWQRLWFLGSGSESFNDVLVLATETIPSGVNLDVYLVGGRTSLKRQVGDFVLLSEKRERNAYGQEADFLIYTGTMNGVAIATMNYTVLGHDVAIDVAVTSTSDRIDAVVAREMPFLSTLSPK